MNITLGINNYKNKVIFIYLLFIILPVFIGTEPSGKKYLPLKRTSRTG